MTQLGGLKNDDEKPDLSLFSAVWLFGVGSVLTFGKKKYAAHNWRKGIKISRLMAAALRHILAFNNGEDADPESGLSHLDHASCCIMFARELIETRRKEVDDRYRAEQLELPFPKNTAETQWNGRVPGDKREPEGPIYFCARGGCGVITTKTGYCFRHNPNPEPLPIRGEDLKPPRPGWDFIPDKARGEGYIARERVEPITDACEK